MAWGAIGGAVAGAAANKFFGNGSSKTGTTKIEYPDWVKDRSKLVLDMGENLAERPYQRYPGERVAGWGPGSETAYDLTFGTSGNWAPYLQQGTGLGQLAMSYAQPDTFSRPDLDVFNGRTLRAGKVSPLMWDEAQAERYMNPYISEALAPAVRDAQLAFTSDILGDRRSAAAEGAFGGTRQAIIDSENRRRAETGIADMLSRGYAGAYESALGAFGADAGRKLQADISNVDRKLATGMWNKEQLYRQEAENRAAAERAFGLNEGSKWNAVRSLLNGGDFFNRLGQMTSSLTGTDLERMWLAGDREQAMRQLQMDQEYQDWLEARDWDARGMDYMIRALGGTPYGGRPSEVREYGAGTNPAATIAGAASVGASLWNQFQNRNTQTPPPVTSYAPPVSNWAPSNRFTESVPSMWG